MLAGKFPQAGRCPLRSVSFLHSRRSAIPEFCKTDFSEPAVGDLTVGDARQFKNGRQFAATGFDQPLLCAMYVDKRLDGVQDAVPTLSRLNRKIAGKDEPFVLDFVNKPEEIYAAFKPSFDSTSLQELANPEMLPSIKHELDQLQI